MLKRWYRASGRCCDLRPLGYDCREGCPGPSLDPLGSMARAATTGCVGTGETGLLADGLAERIATHVREDGEWMCHGWAHPEEIVLVGCTADDALRAEASE